MFAAIVASFATCDAVVEQYLAGVTLADFRP